MKILLVDDDSNVREAFRDMFTDHGHKVTEARNGRDGLQVFMTSGPFDRVLSDYQMPGLNGAQMAEQIRKVDANIPIAIASGDWSMEKRIPEGVAFLKKGSIRWRDIVAALKVPE